MILLENYLFIVIEVAIRMRKRRVPDRATPLSFDVSFLENPCDYPHKFYLPKLESLNFMTPATVLLCQYFVFSARQATA